MNQKKAEADDLKAEYLHLRAIDRLEESLAVEKKYAALRIEIIDEVTQEINSRKSITMAEARKRVEALPPIEKIRTGIFALDKELVPDDKKKYTEMGGFSLGNFVQIAGAKYSGKTTLMMKIITNFSESDPVSWFDFEMGMHKAVSTAELFKRDEHKINYYDGSRKINDVIDEIKFLYADGVRHFVIDSMMKLTAKGHKRGYETASYISSLLSELTSTMVINIYMINQMSQDSLRNGDLFMKHGNDIEYDSDYIFFVMRKTTGSKDQYGLPIYDENCRVLICTKNRVDHNTFNVEIQKNEIL